MQQWGNQNVSVYKLSPFPFRATKRFCTNCCEHEDVKPAGTWHNPEHSVVLFAAKNNRLLKWMQSFNKTIGKLRLATHAHLSVRTNCVFRWSAPSKLTTYIQVPFVLTAALGVMKDDVVGHSFSSFDTWRVIRLDTDCWRLEDNLTYLVHHSSLATFP